MKKILFAFMLAVLLPGSALAANTGLYITPKLFYGYTDMDKVKNDNYWGSYYEEEKSGENDHVFGGGLALGYDFYIKTGAPLRAELEYSIFSQAEGDFRKSDYDWSRNDEYILKATMKHDIQTVFFNLYWDFYTGTRFTPYVNAGLGAAFIRSKGGLDESYIDYYDSSNNGFASHNLGSNSDTNFAWNVGLGFAVHLTDNLALDMGYRFVGLGKSRTGSSVVDSAWNGMYSSRNETEYLYMHQVALGLRITF